ncbi:MAG: CPBP family glutamic-type intramembrane protease [Bacteroidota bacterium]
MKRILPISLFLLISLAWSYVFFVERPLDFVFDLGWGHWALLLAWLPPLGMFLISLLLRRTDPSPEPTSFFGHSSKWSILIALLPVGLLSAFGVSNDYGIQANLFGLFMGGLLLGYTLLEEYGWRGYLQDALPIKREWLKYGLIGLIWYVWHWDFVGAAISWNALLFLGLMAFGALGMGRLADHKKSILICAAFHCMGNIALFSTFLQNHMPLNQRLILVGICILAWIILFKIWDRKDVPNLASLSK